MLIVVVLGFFASGYFKTALGKATYSRKTANKPSVLTMRFENQTGAADNNYLNNGITENLVTTLSKSELLFIPLSHTGRFVLQNNLTDAEVWSEYGIKYILRGSVQRSASRLHISVQMTDTGANEVIWSEIYDFEKEVIRLRKLAAFSRGR